MRGGGGEFWFVAGANSAQAAASSARASTGREPSTLPVSASAQGPPVATTATQA